MSGVNIINVSATPLKCIIVAYATIPIVRIVSITQQTICLHSLWQSDCLC